MSKKIDPGKLTPETLALLLTNAGQRLVTEDQVREIAEAGGLLAPDETVSRNIRRSCFRRTASTSVRRVCRLGKTLEHETEVVKRLGIRQASAKELADDGTPVVQWIKENKIKRLAIHFDLDVLDPAFFRSLYFSDPQAAPGAFDGITQGTMTSEQVVRLIADVSKETDVVGLSIAEHLPWDARNLKNMLEQLPLPK